MRELRSTPEKLAYQSDRHRKNREAQRCINENSAGTHGPATHGCRCAHCYDVHKVGAERARDAKSQTATATPNDAEVAA